MSLPRNFAFFAVDLRDLPHPFPPPQAGEGQAGSTSAPRQGAQERLVPVRNGSLPEAPAGGHITHVGALLEDVPVALPAEPAELVAAAGLDRAPLRVVKAGDDVFVVPPPEAGAAVAAAAGATPDEPAVVVPVAVEAVDGAVVTFVGFAPVVAGTAAALLPSVTAPRLVTAYGFAAVCAAAGTMAAKNNSAAQRNSRVIMQRHS